MTLLPDAPITVSASRTKDMVRRSPDLLADILQGEAPSRWGPHGPFGRVDPAALHSIVLWTKDPRPLLTHERLRTALRKLVDRRGVLISLQVTATGMGGSFIEPGIPPWQVVRDILGEIFAEGWISPSAAVYRFDPFIAVGTPAGKVVSNADLSAFETVCGAFLDLGVARVTASRGDAQRYPKVAQRMAEVGLEWLHLPDAAASALCRAMDEFCRSHGAEFSVCCDPEVPGLTDAWGCVDARRLNTLKGGANPAIEILHNRIGKQRPACRCTYSRDIGYSTGSAGCYSGGFGCLYCYAQGNALLPQPDKIRTDIAEFDRDPKSYAARLGLAISLEAPPLRSGAAPPPSAPPVRG